jgi:hypothetical protein
MQGTPILAEDDSYGYAIIKRARELSGGRVKWTDGMLYPVLHRLERHGFVEARWEVAETGRQAFHAVGQRVSAGRRRLRRGALGAAPAHRALAGGGHRVRGGALVNTLTRVRKPALTAEIFMG